MDCPSMEHVQLVLSDIKTESDSLSTYVIYHPNGQVAQEFQIKPALGLDGLATFTMSQVRLSDNDFMKKERSLKPSLNWKSDL